MDMVGPLPETSDGFTQLLTVIDHFSKFAFARPLKNVTANTIAKELYLLFCQEGVPSVLISDQGVQFTAELTTALTTLFGVDQRFSTTYHPQTNGITERFNQTLKAQLAIQIQHNQTDWDIFVPMVVASYNNTVHESTRETPFFIARGRDTHLPVDLVLGIERADNFDTMPICFDGAARNIQEIIQEVRDFSHNARVSQKHHFDASHTRASFKLNDRVWLHTPRTEPGESSKLTAFWSGPFRIISINDANAVIINLSNPDDTRTVNVARLKFDYEFVPRSSTTSSEVTSTSPAEFDIVSILDERRVNGQEQYLVKWKGFSRKYNSWVNREDLLADDLLQKFQVKQLAGKAAKREQTQPRSPVRSTRRRVNSLTSASPEALTRETVQHRVKNNNA
jgi:hypothetical protein